MLPAVDQQKLLSVDLWVRISGRTRPQIMLLRKENKNIHISNEYVWGYSFGSPITDSISTSRIGP